MCARHCLPPLRGSIVINAMFSRLELLIGHEALQRLQQAHVLLLGVGGVGSWAAEILVRSAIGHLTIIDCDTVRQSNINRQIEALHSTIGQPKTDAIASRLRDINPNLDLNALDIRLTPDNVPSLLDSCHWDYVIDAIDERPPKLAALVHCVNHHLPVISSMGAANKTISDGIRVADISETSGCHLARILRKSLRKLGIESGINVVFSDVLPEKTMDEAPEKPGERRPLGTIACVPSAFGIKCAEKVITDIISKP